MKKQSKQTWGFMNVETPSCHNCKHVELRPTSTYCHLAHQEESPWALCEHSISMYKKPNGKSWWEWDGKK